MVQISIIKYSDTSKEDRIDAEYYQPEYLKVEERLASIKTCSIEEISESVVNFGAYSLCNHIEWQESGVPYLNVRNIKEGYIDFENVKFISEKVNDILKKSKVKERQVIITMAGTIGNSAITHKVPKRINSNQATAKITLKKGFSPYYLVAFLNSYYGRKQTEREIVSSVQPNIFLRQIKNFKVPVVSKEKQKVVEKIYIAGLEELENSKSLYQQAKDLLLEELGLKNFEPENDLSYVVDFSDTESVGRLDAEYFQPKYDELLEKIRMHNPKNLENFIESYSTGYPFQSVNYQEEGIPLIRINNIKSGYLDLSDTAYLSEKDYLLSPKDTAKSGDIVLSMSGTIGTAAIVPNNIPQSSINQRILRITPKDIDKYYLTILLNAIIGLYQLQRVGTGGVQTNIGYKDIKQILIPILPKLTQRKIADLVHQSHAARKKAKQLLEQAKQKVEDLIEKG